MNTDKIYAEQLANEYTPKDTSKVIALRKLDKKPKLPATVFTYTFGIIAALVAGVGMCLSMKIIGRYVRPRCDCWNHRSAGYGCQLSHLQKTAGTEQAEICF